MEYYYLDESKISESALKHIHGKICEDNCIPRPIKSALMDILGDEATIKDGIEILLPNVYYNLKALPMVGDIHAAQFFNYLQWLGLARYQPDTQLTICKEKEQVLRELKKFKEKELRELKKRIDNTIKDCLDKINKTIELQIQELQQQ